LRTVLVREGGLLSSVLCGLRVVGLLDLQQRCVFYPALFQCLTCESCFYPRSDPLPRYEENNFLIVFTLCYSSENARNNFNGIGAFTFPHFAQV
jgi:hypothetical protein